MNISNGNLELGNLHILAEKVLVCCSLKHPCL